MTKVGAVDVTTEVLNLKKAQPDYVIFQGYVLAPIPEVIRAARDHGLETTFMSTFWSMDKGIIEKLGPDAEGYMGVNPYGYYWEDVPGIVAMRKYNEKNHPAEKYRPNSYIQGWFTGMVYVETIRRIRRGEEAGHRRQPEGRARHHQGLGHRRRHRQGHLHEQQGRRRARVPRERAEGHLRAGLRLDLREVTP